MPIRPGNLTLNPIDYSEFADSLAERIEEELNDLLALDGLPRLPTDIDDREVRDRRRLFVAIARAVVHHLDDRRTSITIERDDVTPTHPIFDIDWG